MATNFSATIEHASDILFDYNCLSCSDNDKSSEANYFCQDCCQCFCDLCIQLHNKLHRRHSLLDKKDVDKWSTTAALVGPLARCDRHPDETLKLECIDHHQLCCHHCTRILHKYVYIVHF